MTKAYSSNGLTNLIYSLFVAFVCLPVYSMYGLKRTLCSNKIPKSMKNYTFLNICESMTKYS